MVELGGRGLRRGACGRAIGLLDDRSDRLLGRARDVRAVRRRAAATHGGDPLVGRARAEREATELGDPRKFRADTGVVLNAASHAAKVAWVARTAPEALDGARWILQPRDFVVARLTGVVVTDESLASRTGLYALAGGWLASATAAYGERLPAVVSSTAIVGRRRVRSRAGARAGCPHERRDRCGRPRVRGGRNRRVEAHTDGVLGNHGERLRAMRRPARRVAGGRLGVMWRARELRRRSGTLGRGRRGGVVGVTHRANARRPLLGRDGGGTGCAGAGRAPVVRRRARGPWWRPDAHAAFIGLTDARRARRARARSRRGHRAGRRPVPRAHRTRTRGARARRRGRRARALAQRACRRDWPAGAAPRGRRRRVGRRPADRRRRARRSRSMSTP